MVHLGRSSLGVTALAVVLGATLAGGVVAPAYAGGDNQQYVHGATKSRCTTNLNNAVRWYRANDFVVTGIHGCRLTGDRKRYFGDFVANPR